MKHFTVLRAMAGASLALVLSCGVSAPAFANESEELQKAQNEIETQVETAEAAEDLALSLSEDASEGELTEIHDMLSRMNTSALDSSLSSLASNGGSTNYQFLFAQLQLEAAEEARKNALEQIEAANQMQELVSTTNEWVNTCWTATNDLSGSKNAKKEIPAELVVFCEEHGIEMPESASSGTLDEEGWNSLAESLLEFLESIGSESQNMVYLQDYISQYNSLLMSANTAISDASQVYATQGVRGTMLGSEGGVGMLATGGLVGLAIGVVGTLAVVRTSEKKRAKNEAE